MLNYKSKKKKKKKKKTKKKKKKKNPIKKLFSCNMDMDVCGVKVWSANAHGSSKNLF